MHNKKEEGILTLEAALLMPLFCLLMLFFYNFLVFFAGSQMITHAAFQTAQSLTLDSYAEQTLKGATNEAFISVIRSGEGFFTDGFSTANNKWYSNGSSVENVVKERFEAYLFSGKSRSDNDALKLYGVDGANIDFSGSKVENGVLTIEIKYKQSFMFNVFDLMNFDRTITVKAKMWGI